MVSPFRTRSSACLSSSRPFSWRHCWPWRSFSTKKAGFKVQGSMSKVRAQGLKFKIQNSKFKIQHSRIPSRASGGRGYSRTPPHRFRHPVVLHHPVGRIERHPHPGRHIRASTLPSLRGGLPRSRDRCRDSQWKGACQGLLGDSRSDRACPGDRQLAAEFRLAKRGCLWRDAAMKSPNKPRPHYICQRRSC